MGSNRASIYKITDNKSVKCIATYLDDAWMNYLCINWAVDKKTCAPLLCIGGKLGVIKILI